MRYRVGPDNNDLRAAVDDLAREIGIALGPPLAGIPLDGEVLSLDVAQSAQLSEKRRPSAKSCVADDIDGTRGRDDCNSVLPRPLLCLNRADCSGEQQKGGTGELARPALRRPSM